MHFIKVSDLYINLAQVTHVVGGAGWIKLFFTNPVAEDRGYSTTQYVTTGDTLDLEGDDARKVIAALDALCE